MGTNWGYYSSELTNMNNLSIFCLLATLVAVSCYSGKQEPLDYCTDIYSETFCAMEKDENCFQSDWLDVCAKTCAYRDAFNFCANDLDLYCSRFEYRKFCLKSCYERDCTSKKISDENIDEERILLKQN